MYKFDMLKLKRRILDARELMFSASEWRDYAIGVEDMLDFTSMTHAQKEEISELLLDIEEEYKRRIWNAKSKRPSLFN